MAWQHKVHFAPCGGRVTNINGHIGTLSHLSHEMSHFLLLMTVANEKLCLALGLYMRVKVACQGC